MKSFCLNIWSTETKVFELMFSIECRSSKQRWATLLLLLLKNLSLLFFPFFIQIYFIHKKLEEPKSKPSVWSMINKWMIKMIWQRIRKLNNDLTLNHLNCILVMLNIIKCSHGWINIFQLFLLIISYITI